MQRLALQGPQRFALFTELELHPYLLRRFIRQDGPQANTSVGALSIHAPVQEADHVLGFRKQTFQASPRDHAYITLCHRGSVPRMPVFVKRYEAFSSSSPTRLVSR